MFARVFAFGIAIALKTMSLVFYRTLVRWITPRDRINWEELKIVIVLNHTSLFEPLFISAVPNKRIWRALGRLIVPIADVTLNRPLTGWIFRLLVPGAVSITRKRDETWDRFVSKARSGALTLIFPEGRMKRKNGLDKNGNQ